MTFIDGRAIAKQYSFLLKDFIKTLQEKPGLAMILIGDNPASQVYVGQKEKKCKELGIYSEILNLPHSIEMQEVLNIIHVLNKRTDIHGILLQLPVPLHLDKETLLCAIDPYKDVDGLHPHNLGALFIGNPIFVPCTPQGCLQAIRSVCKDITGKTAVILGRSVLVGKSMAMLLLQADVTVQMVHSKSRDIPSLCQKADIIVSAMGQSKLINKNYVKKGQIVIDVGITKIDGKLYGDTDFEVIKDIVEYITPVPGGVGPLTVFNLMLNTVYAFTMRHKISLSESLKTLLP